MVDRHGRLLFDMPADPSSARPELDRGELRRLLIDSLAPGTIRWGHKLTSVRHPVEGGYDLTFAEGPAARADIVIDADGAWSKVGSGTLMAVAPGQGIIAHRYADGHVRGYVALNEPEEWTRSIDFGDPSVGLRQMADEFDGEAVAVAQRLRDEQRRTAVAPPHLRPSRRTQVDRKPSATLIGDAAHLMSPFAGEGANLAMYDGADLASELAEEPDIEVALTVYEERLFLRSSDAARRSVQDLETFFGREAPQSVVTLFDRF